MKEKIRLAKPYLGDKKDLIVLLEEVLESGFLIQGKYVAQFEEKVAAYLGVKHAIAVSSGTAALHLALMTLGIGPGDEVIIPAYTFPATANMVEVTGAKPVLVDVDLETYNIDIGQTAEAISPNTKAIMPVHLFGNPADMDALMEVARKHNLSVIEDAAGAFGSIYKDKKCGTIGNLGCLSFHPRKIITTGEGGMVVTDDGDLATKVRSLRNHGMQTASPHPDFTAAGLNYRMNELEAVLGVVQMREIQTITDERQSLARLYTKSLNNIESIAFQKMLPDCETVWQAFVIRLKDRLTDSILNQLREAGIEANIGTYAIHLLQFYKNRYNFQPADFPNAKELYERSLALPFFNKMTIKEMNQVKEKLKQLLE